MNIPSELTSAIVRASNAITKQGDLPRPERRKLLKLVGELSEIEHPNAGWLRRSRIELCCSMHVLSRTEPFPELHARARSMLQLGVSALTGAVDLKALEQTNGVYHTEVINFFDHGESAYPAVYAGMACFSAINTILYDTNFDALEVDEIDVSPDDWTAGFYSALAFSGSAVWELKGGEELRREFWSWYLNRAIPYCWNVAAPLSVGSP